jgi:hypothetical protein
VTSTFSPELAPTWVKIAAWAVPLTTIPSIAWRMITVVDGLLSGDNPCIVPSAPLTEKLYLLIVLPSVQLGVALLTVGLIRPWGEVFPRWMPALGGRRVPVAFAVGSAITGAVFLVLVLGRGAVTDLLGVQTVALEPLPPGCSVPGWDILRWYAPMFLWPALLLAVTWHYLRRRTHRDHADAETSSELSRSGPRDGGCRAGGWEGLRGPTRTRFSCPGL